MLKHYRGEKNSYKYNPNAPYDAEASAHRDGIYFATNTHEILMNGEVYGSSSGSSADITTTADITISGGPLASDFTNNSGTSDNLSLLPDSWKIKDTNNNVTGYKIPANTTLQDVLSNLFCTEVWPQNAKVTPGNFTANIGQVTIDGWPAETILKEVGATINIGTSFIGGFSINKTATKFTGFTYGYADTQGNKTKNANPADVSINDVVITNNNAKYEFTADCSELTGTVITGPQTGVTFQGNKITKSSSIDDDGSQSGLIPGFDFTVKQGVNKLTYSLQMLSTDPEKTASVDFSSSTKATETYYPLSSLYNISSTPVNALTSTSLSKSLNGVLISGTSIKFTGVYPIYTNGTWAIEPTTTDAEDGQSNAIKAWSTTNKTTNSNLSKKLTSITNNNAKFYAFIAYGNGGFKFELDPDWSITKAQTASDNLTGKFDGDYTGFTQTTQTKHGVGYKVYNFPLAAKSVIRLEITHV